MTHSGHTRLLRILNSIKNRLSLRDGITELKASRNPSILLIDQKWSRSTSFYRKRMMIRIQINRVSKKYTGPLLNMLHQQLKSHITSMLIRNKKRGPRIEISASGIEKIFVLRPVIKIETKSNHRNKKRQVKSIRFKKRLT